MGQHVKRTGVPWVNLGLPLNVPWESHGPTLVSNGRPMGDSWVTHGTPLFAHGRPMSGLWAHAHVGGLRDTQGRPMGHHCKLTAVPRVAHGSPIDIPWEFGEPTLSSPGRPMGDSWKHYKPMRAPWESHGPPARFNPWKSRRVLRSR